MSSEAPVATRVIVVGGGLSGLSAAHSVLERGGRVLLLDKNAFCGGNSTKATSGINGALTRQQQRLGIPDSVDKFLEDTAKSAVSTYGKGGKVIPDSAEATPLAAALVINSAPAVEWLSSRFGLDLSIVNRLGGHSFPRTHRGKEKFPGMTITYALMEKLEDIAKKDPQRAQVKVNCRVTELLSHNGAVVGCKYTTKDGKTFTEHGPVVLATGGFGADFSDSGLLKQLRPELLPLPTTNGDHCTGDGMKMAANVGAHLVDMEQVQVHPTGLVHPDEPNAKVKFLAAEALRGCGGILLNKNGERFCDELGTRDYVSGEMMKFKGEPYRLVLNGLASKEIEWHCKHYMGRGLMKYFPTGEALAKEMGVPVSKLKATFDAYNQAAEAKKAGKDIDPFKKKFFPNGPWHVNDHFHAAWVTPVVHYCMGGIRINPEAEVLNKNGQPVPGLFAAGETTGGVHGNNRLGGSSLIDCVVYGRLSGDSAAKYLFSTSLNTLANPAYKRLGAVASHLAPGVQKVVVEVSFGGGAGSQATTVQQPDATQSAPEPQGSIPKDTSYAPLDAAAAPAQASKVYRLSEVAKHNKPDDCWVAVNGQVLNVTKFLPDHPGGAKAILLYAGKDASEEFNMLHKPDVVEKYAAYTIIGTLDPQDIKKH